MSRDTDEAPPAGGAPLYEVVDGIIRQRLVDNIWPPGTMLPSEMRLAEEFGVSQGTVRRALEAMVAEGLLYRRQGKGTFVSEMGDRRELFLFFNMTGPSGERSMPEARLLTVDQGPANAEEIARLELTEGATVRRLSRLRLFAGAPVIVERVVVPEALLPGLGSRAPVPDHLFRHYEMDYGVTIVRATEDLSACAATAEEGRLLDLPAGAPLLEVDRVARSLRGAVEWRVSRCNTRHYKYRARRG